MAQSAIRGQFRKIATSCPFGLNKVRAPDSLDVVAIMTPQEVKRGRG